MTEAIKKLNEVAAEGMALLTPLMDTNHRNEVGPDGVQLTVVKGQTEDLIFKHYCSDDCPDSQWTSIRAPSSALAEGERDHMAIWCSKHPLRGWK